MHSPQKNRQSSHSLLPSKHVGHSTMVHTKTDPNSIELYCLFELGHVVWRGLKYSNNLQLYNRSCFILAEGAKKEDLVHNVFDVVAREHVATILNSCRVSGATEVFLCGNVFNTEIMRDLTIHHKMVLESYIAMVICPSQFFSMQK